MAGDRERPLQLGQQAASRAQRLGLRSVQHDPELVAADARDHGVVGQRRHDPLGHDAHHRVAGRVPERVVDGLEVVQVDEQHRPCGVGRCFGARRQQAREGRPVGEPGQVVAEGLRVQLGLEVEALEQSRRDVGEDARHLDRGRVEHVLAVMTVEREERSDPLVHQKRHHQDRGQLAFAPVLAQHARRLGSQLRGARPGPDHDPWLGVVTRVVEAGRAPWKAHGAQLAQVVALRGHETVVAGGVPQQHRARLGAGDHLDRAREKQPVERLGIGRRQRLAHQPQQAAAEQVEAHQLLLAGAHVLVAQRGDLRPKELAAVRIRLQAPAHPAVHDAAILAQVALLEPRARTRADPVHVGEALAGRRVLGMGDLEVGAADQLVRREAQQACERRIDRHEASLAVDVAHHRLARLRRHRVPRPGVIHHGLPSSSTLASQRRASGGTAHIADRAAHSARTV